MGDRNKWRQTAVPDAAQNREPDSLEARTLPPRSVIHSAERWKWARRFYQFLVFLFILLLIGLFLWGGRYTSRAVSPTDGPWPPALPAARSVI